MLPGEWSGQTLLELAFRTLFIWERGYLISDDTVIPKPFATPIEGLAWVFSSQERRPVYGLSLVLLVWTNRALRVPLGMRLWRKGGPWKNALAVQAQDEALLVANGDDGRRAVEFANAILLASYSRRQVALPLNRRRSTRLLRRLQRGSATLDSPENHLA
jgi:hypothetical protein